MSVLTKVKQLHARFLSETRGSLSIEMVLIIPLLIWAIAASFVFYDGFRTKMRVQTAANTVVDALTRETATLTTEHLEDLNNVFDALVAGRGNMYIRVSSVAQIEEDEPPVLAWSHGARGLPAAESLADISRDLPPVLLGDSVIVVEAFGGWVPPLPLAGLERLVRMDVQVAARPRFSPWLPLEGSEVTFTSYNAEWANPDANYDPHDAGDMQPYAPVCAGNSGSSNGNGNGNNCNNPGVAPSNQTPAPGNTGATSGTAGTSGTGDGDGGGTVGGGSGIGNPDRPLQQVGLWTFDNPNDRHRDEAQIRNSSQIWGNPQWRQNDGGLYTNDGGFWLDNCQAGSAIRRANNGQQNYLHIPWHQDYDLTSATVRMVFKLDALPIANSFWRNSETGEISVNWSNGSVWALFSRDAAHQNEPGHFSSFVTGDGAVFVRFQVWSDIAFYGAQYAGTNWFAYAPPGSVQPGTTYDMQITFDHELSRMDLYLNGDLMDRVDDVPITLAGNQEPWVLGASSVNSNTGSHRTPNQLSYLCGTVYHFEVWEGAYSAREVQVMSCGIEPNSEDWFEYFYLNLGRYPLPGEGLAASPGSEGLCRTVEDDDDIPPPPPQPVCTAQTLADQNFEMSAATNWSIQRTEHRSAQTRFLGRFGRDETVTWSNTVPSDAAMLLIDFDLYVFGTWDGIGHGWSGPLGDRLDIMVNNQLIAYKHFMQADGPGQATFASYLQPVTYTANVGGADYVINMAPAHGGFTPWQDQHWKVSMSVTNPPSSFNLGFRARTDEDVNNESWGLDNFNVSTSCEVIQQAVPTHVITTNIPYYWNNTYQNWMVRPPSIPPADWNNRPFSISGDGGVEARDQWNNWVTSGTLGWDGVSLRLTTPARGTTSTVLLEVGPHLIQYIFNRAANP